MVSTIGTARGTTHGSWRPLAANATACPSKSAVSWVRPIVAGGLKATRKKIGSPFEIPPWMPPEKLVRVPTGPLFLQTSRCGPSPACGCRKTGADLEPFGRRDREHGLGQLGFHLVEDRLAPSGRDVSADTGDDPADRILFLFAASISFCIRVAVSWWGQRTGVRSTSALEIFSMSTSGAEMLPTALTHATISTPQSACRNFSAIAPAATRAMVSRALDRPPPLAARMPYFI